MGLFLLEIAKTKYNLLRNSINKMTEMKITELV